MAHIALNNDFPGIVGLMFHKPSTGRALAGLAQQVLRGPSGLTPAERELIAARVSSANQCTFCMRSHAATATALSGDQAATACAIGDRAEGLTPKMRALCDLAAKVAESGRAVTKADVDAAKAAGATDEDVYDAVMVAAAFCLFNRIVDGLGTTTPTGDDYYAESGAFLAKRGYKKPSAVGRFFIARAQRRRSR